MSGSPSLKHSVPNPNLYEETDHLAMRPISGHGRMGGRRPRIHVSVSIIVLGGKHECKLWCIIGRPSLGMLAAAGGAELLPAFCASSVAPPVGVAMLDKLEV